MYCPKCNLHTEDHVDRCPLCDGRLKVDEGAWEEAARNASDASAWTRERILERGKEILGARELEDVLRPEESRETPEVPQLREEKALSEEKEQPFEQDPAPEETYSIHVGSFKVKEYAFDLRDRLQNKGYPVLCSLFSVPGKGEWYRVEVGYYANPEEAQQALSKLETEEKFATLSLLEHCPPLSTKSFLTSQASVSKSSYLSQHWRFLATLVSCQSRSTADSA